MIATTMIPTNSKLNAAAAQAARTNLVQDLHCHQVPVRRHQEDRRTDRRHRPHKGKHQTAEEGWGNERQSNAPEYSLGIST